MQHIPSDVDPDTLRQYARFVPINVRAGGTGRAVCRTRKTRGEASTSQAGISRQKWTTHRKRYEGESEEEMLFDQFKTLGDFPVQSSPDPPPPPPQPTAPPFETTDQQTQPAVVEEAAKTTWEQLTSARMEDVWDDTRTSASTAQDIAQGFRQHRD
ncbi:hypothetical protein PIB30_070786 [Stylosanthes scabra]|uniref:Uncharacterized protein n=1 Tax=Stylosanthes scabra TaxID=79078 RepID=A0ABU6TQ51_9FABA|nr:hypothetical protein [Stylosanthes scabra]